jgi:hypothetical protein
MARTQSPGPTIAGSIPAIPSDPTFGAEPAALASDAASASASAATAADEAAWASLSRAHSRRERMDGSGDQNLHRQ